MSIENNTRVPRPAHNYVPEYQQSGIPWVTTKILPSAANAAALIANISNYKIDFDFVTRWIKIHSHDDGAGKVGLRLYFNEDAAKTAYNELANQDPHYYLFDLEEISERLELKCKYIYLVPSEVNKASNVAIIAGLTNIRSLDFPDQTYNNGFLGVQNNPN